MEELQNSQRYLCWLLVITIAGSLAVVIFVLIVDPYRQYGIVQYRGFNIIKPTLERYQNEIKLSQVKRLKPDVLILGNSRAEIGFDPDALVFNQKGLSAYNLSIPGIGIKTVYQQLLYLTKNGINPGLIFLGLDFLDFIDLPSQQEVNASIDPSQYLIDQQRKIESWFWRFDSMFSLASVRDAFRTLAIQNNEEAAIITFHGFNPLNEYKPIVRAEGYYKLFQQRAQENVRTYLKKAQGSVSPMSLNYLQAIFNLVEENNSKIILVIYPYHAQILALFEVTNLWPLFNQWKSLVVNELIDMNQYSTQIELYDYSGYSLYHCERIPPIGDLLSITQWYWEAGHFKKELGDIILEEILRSNETILSKVMSMNHSQTSFGIRLLDQNSFLLNHNRIIQQRLMCESNYPELFTDAAILARAAQ